MNFMILQIICKTRRPLPQFLNIFDNETVKDILEIEMTYRMMKTRLQIKMERHEDNENYNRNKTKRYKTR